MSGPTGYTIQTMGESSGAPIYQNVNSEVIAILQDANYLPESSNGLQHLYNPQKTFYFTGHVSPTTNGPGVGPDYVLRDPWNNPYIITLDLNYDNKCFDYTLNEMYTTNNSSAAPLFVPGEAVIWSFGPYPLTVQFTQPLYTGINHKTLVTSF